MPFILIKPKVYNLTIVVIRWYLLNETILSIFISEIQNIYVFATLKPSFD